MGNKTRIRWHLSDVLARAPRTARVVLIPPRVFNALKQQRTTFWNLLKWTFNSRETTNFTYDITERNKEYLAWFLSAVTGQEKDTTATYLHELEKDSALRDHLAESFRRSPLRYKADLKPRYGRRLGWYAIVRIRRPRVVVETGTDKGLGSVVIAAALARNTQEGHPGHLYTIDINPRAGWLLKGPYSRHAEVLVGDSLRVLSAFNQPIDMFVNDSDHSPRHEEAEYEAVSTKLTPDSIIVGDNAERTTKLLEFAERTGRRFLFFREESKEHWYPGGGVGVAFH